MENNEQRISLIQEASPGYFSELFVPNKEKEQLFAEYKNLNGLTGITAKIKINIKSGIDSTNHKDIEERRRIYGNNDPIVKEPNSLWEYIVECLEDKMLRILLGAALISTIIGVIQEGWKTGWLEGFAIFFAVFVVVSITSVNNYSKEKQFMLLSLENQKKQVNVRRDGIDKSIQIEELVVGDVLKIAIGNIIPVDGVMVEGEVQIDESSLTGESDLVKKQNEYEINKNKSKVQGKVISPIVFSGTSVKQGSGYMLVCAVGVNSHQGKTTLLMQNEGSNELTPLQEKLKVLADKISDFGLIAAIVIGFSIFFKESLARIYHGNVIFSSTIFDTLVNAFILAVAVIVVAIPEGLPLAVAISLAYSVLKLKDENNLVRHMDSAETMGGVQQICSDKTGTLTNGVMTVKDIYMELKKITFKSVENSFNSENLKMLYKSVLNNKEALIETDKEGKLNVTGNMTDIALINALIDNKVNVNNYLEYSETDLQENVNVKTLPFNSEYKMMAKFYKLKDGSYRIYVKGAPERLYDRTLNYLIEDNKTSHFTNDVWNKFKETQDVFAEQSMRTLLFLYSDTLGENEFNQITEQSFSNWENLINNLTIIEMLGIADTKRDNVEESIKILTSQSGINVKMVTGDNILTAIAISKDVGILDDTLYKRALIFVKAKEKNKQRINVINQEIKELEYKLKTSEIDRNKVVNLKKELDSKSEERLLLQRNIYDSNGNLIEDEMIAMEGEEFQRLTGGYKEKKANLHFKPSEENQNNDKNKEFVLQNEKSFRKVVKNLRVIARASPEDKYLLVLGLKQIGNVVAVTGDGTNDAPALRVADVGFAMGKRGTDICKEASDIVILNDSFDSIVTAVKYGRNVFDCIRKFLQFQLTTNVVAVLMTFIGGIFLRDAPLNAIQMLWVNLIMDSFASLALATEPPNEDLLNRKPYKRNENMVTRMMMYNVIAQSIFQIVILCIILAYGDIIFGVPSDRNLQHYKWNNTNGYHFTIFFNIFVFMQVFNSINARKLKKTEFNIFENINNNPLYILVQLVIISGQIILVTFGGRPVRRHPLTINQHFFCILIAALCIPFGMFIKILPFEDVTEESVEEEKPVETIYKKIMGGRESIRSKSSRISKVSLKK